MKSGFKGLSPTAGGFPIPRDVVERRLRDCEAIYVNTLSSERTYQQMRQLHGISRSTAARYLKRVFERMDAAWQQHRPHVQTVHAQRVAQMTELARQDRKWSAVMQGEQLLARIAGAMAPDKIEHAIASNGSYAAALADGWTEEQIAQFVQTGQRPDAQDPPAPGGNGHDPNPQVH